MVDKKRKLSRADIIARFERDMGEAIARHGRAKYALFGEDKKRTVADGLGDVGNILPSKPSDPLNTAWNDAALYFARNLEIGRAKVRIRKSLQRHGYDSLDEAETQSLENMGKQVFREVADGSDSSQSVSDGLLEIGHVGQFGQYAGSDFDSLFVTDPAQSGGDADRLLDDAAHVDDSKPIPIIEPEEGSEPDGEDEYEYEYEDIDESDPGLLIGPLSPEAGNLASSILPGEREGASTEADLDTLLLKFADMLTDDEVRVLGQQYWALPASDPRRAAADGLRRDFYDLTYGKEAADVDDTGRMIEPAPKRQVPEQTAEIKTPGGEALIDGLKRAAGTLARAATDDGVAPAVKALQTGLGLLGERLKVDGEAGPKTRAALTRTIAQKGTGKAEEALALGRFHGFAKAERDGGGSASGLRDAVETRVQPLFASSPPGRHAAEALQESLNDLGAEAARVRNLSAPEPLKIDGDIGPKTTDAFRSVLGEHGPDKLTERYGLMLGFS